MLDLRHEEDEAKRENLSILSGLMNMRNHRASSYRNKCLKILQAGRAGNATYKD